MVLKCIDFELKYSGIFLTPDIIMMVPNAQSPKLPNRKMPIPYTGANEMAQSKPRKR